MAGAADDGSSDGLASNMADAGSEMGGDEPPDGDKPFRHPGLRTYSMYIYPIMDPCAFLLTELLHSISRLTIYEL